MALTPTTEESGCIQIIPGNYRVGQLEHKTYEDEDNVLFQSQAIENLLEQQPLFSQLMPGELTLHHGWMLHASGPNQTKQHRVGLKSSTTPPRRVSQTKFVNDTAILVSGVDEYRHY